MKLKQLITNDHQKTLTNFQRVCDVLNTEEDIAIFQNDEVRIMGWEWQDKGLTIRTGNGEEIEITEADINAGTIKGNELTLSPTLGSFKFYKYKGVKL